jgi:protein-tyrosine kinase
MPQARRRIEPSSTDHNAMGQQAAAEHVAGHRRASLRLLNGDRANRGPRLAVDDLVSLYISLTRALPERSGRVVEFVSPDPGGGVSTVVLGLAQAAGRLGSARVLVCNASFDSRAYGSFGIGRTLGSLEDVASRRMNLDDAIEIGPGRGFALTILSGPDAANSVAFDIDRFDPVLDALRQRFDLILVDAPPTNRSILGLALGKKVDGVVLVLEAERTRAPVAMQARHSIENKGGRILGVVLNKQRYWVPRWLHRWL